MASCMTVLNFMFLTKTFRAVNSIYLTSFTVEEFNINKFFGRFQSRYRQHSTKTRQLIKLIIPALVFTSLLLPEIGRYLPAYSESKTYPMVAIRDGRIIMAAFAVWITVLERLSSSINLLYAFATSGSVKRGFLLLNYSYSVRILWMGSYKLVSAKNELSWRPFWNLASLWYLFKICPLSSKHTNHYDHFHLLSLFLNRLIASWESWPSKTMYHVSRLLSRLSAPSLHIALSRKCLFTCCQIEPLTQRK